MTPQSRKLAIESEVSTTGTDVEGYLARGTDPALTDDVPNREVVAREGDSHCLGLIGLEIDIRKAFQHGRRFICFGWMVNVKLWDL